TGSGGAGVALAADQFLVDGSQRQHGRPDLRDRQRPGRFSWSAVGTLVPDRGDRRRMSPCVASRRLAYASSELGPARKSDRLALTSRLTRVLSSTAEETKLHS